MRNGRTATDPRGHCVRPLNVVRSLTAIERFRILTFAQNYREAEVQLTGLSIGFRPSTTHQDHHKGAYSWVRQPRRAVVSLCLSTTPRMNGVHPWAS